MAGGMATRRTCVLRGGAAVLQPDHSRIRYGMRGGHRRLEPDRSHRVLATVRRRDHQDIVSRRGDGMSEQNLAARARAALDAGEGILRLAPTWVPRSFLMPGGRLKLSREDLYALGTHRGGIDERWFSSTTAAANEGAPPDEGLSYVVHDGDRFTLKDAIASLGSEMIGAQLWEHLQALAGLQQVLRQPRADPAPHAPEPGAGRQARPRGEARELLLPAPAQLDRQQLSRTRSSASSRGRPRPTSTAASSAGTRATTAFSTSPRPIGSSPAPAGWFRRASCTPRARW